MAATSLLARLGLRVATLGSAASLAVAAPLAEDSLSQAAHTHASRIGLFFDRTTGREAISSVVMGVTAFKVLPFGVHIAPATLPGSPVAGDLAIDSADGNKLKSYNGTAWRSADAAAAGSNTQVQFNNSGALSASAEFTYGSKMLGLTPTQAATESGFTTAIYASNTRAVGASGNGGTIGVQVSATLTGAGFSGCATYLYGMDIEAICTVTSGVAGVRGIDLRTSSGSGAGLIGQMYGLKIGANIASGRTVTTHYGLYLAQSNAGTITNNYAIYQTGAAQVNHIEGTFRLIPKALPGTPVLGDIVNDSADSNKLKWYDGTAWQTAGGGGGSAAGSSGELQFNASGAFSASSDLVFVDYGSGTKRLAVSGTHTAADTLFTATSVINSAASGGNYIAASSSVSNNAASTASGHSVLGFDVNTNVVYGTANAASSVYGIRVRSYDTHNHASSVTTNAVYGIHTDAKAACINGSGSLTVTSLYGALLSSTLTGAFGPTSASNVYGAYALCSVTDANVSGAAHGVYGVVNISGSGTVAEAIGNKWEVNLNSAVTAATGVSVTLAGAGAATSAYGINIQATDLNSGSVTGIRVSSGSDGSAPGSLVGIDCTSGHYGTGTTTEVYGVKASATVATGLTATTLIAGSFSIGGAGTITTAYALYVGAGIGSLTVTNLYGVYQVGSTARNLFQGLVETASDKAFYIGDSATDGTWRVNRDGNNLVMQRRESGTYVTKLTATA